MTALSDAREQVRELQAKRFNLAADIKAAKADREPHEKRWKAYGDRLRKLRLVAHVAGRYQLMTWAGVTVSSWDLGRAFAGKKKADVADAIANGGVNLNVGSGGVTYKAKGLAPRLRVPDPVAVKAWERAVKASERADARARAAQAAEDAALALVFTTGTKIETAELVARVTETTVVTLALNAHPVPYDKEHELTRMTDGQYGSLAIALRHLEHLTKKVDLPDCSTCQRIAQDVAARDSRIARIKALPRKKMTCPDHGPRLAHFERLATPQRLSLPDGTERRVEDCPAVYCPVDWKLYVDGKQLALDDAKAEKAAAKVKNVTWVCPNPECEETNVTEVHDGLVQCEYCEVQWSAELVKTSKAAA